MLPIFREIDRLFARFKAPRHFVKLPDKRLGKRRQRAGIPLLLQCGGAQGGKRFIQILHLAHRTHGVIRNAPLPNDRLRHPVDHPLGLFPLFGALAVAVGVLRIVHGNTCRFQHLTALPGGIHDHPALFHCGAGKFPIHRIAGIGAGQDKGDVALEPLVHIAVIGQLVMSPLKGSLQPQAECAG